MKEDQSSISRSLTRLAQIERSAVLPAVQELTAVIAGLIITLLLFTHLGAPGSAAILLGFVSLILSAVLKVVRAPNSSLRVLWGRAPRPGSRPLMSDALHGQIHARLDEDTRARNGHPGQRSRR